jgi:CCR4-NOT transcription complex subunit 1
LDAFWGQWSNVEGQISVLRELVTAPVRLLEQEWASFPRVFTRDQFSQASPEVQAHASIELESSVWNCIPLVETVVTLADNESYEGAKLLLKMGMESNAELIILALVQLKTPWNSFHQDLVSKMLLAYLTGVGIVPKFVQTRLWQVNQGLFVSVLLDLYDDDRSSLAKILKLTESLNVRQSCYCTWSFFILIFSSTF